MAKTVSDLPSPHARGVAKYPWNQWLDGQIWCLRRGEDFAARCTPLYIGQIARSAGLRRGLKVTARVAGDDVYIQATPRS